MLTRCSGSALGHSSPPTTSSLAGWPGELASLLQPGEKVLMLMCEALLPLLLQDIPAMTSYIMIGCDVGHENGGRVAVGGV